MRESKSSMPLKDKIYITYYLLSLANLSLIYSSDKGCKT